MSKHSKKRWAKGNGHKSGFMNLKRGIWYAEVRAQQEWERRARRESRGPDPGNASQGGAA